MTPEENESPSLVEKKQKKFNKETEKEAEFEISQHTLNLNAEDNSQQMSVKQLKQAKNKIETTVNVSKAVQGPSYEEMKDEETQKTQQSKIDLSAEEQALLESDHDSSSFVSDTELQDKIDLSKRIKPIEVGPKLKRQTTYCPTQQSKNHKAC